MKFWSSCLFSSYKYGPNTCKSCLWTSMLMTFHLLKKLYFFVGAYNTTISYWTLFQYLSLIAKTYYLTNLLHANIKMNKGHRMVLYS